MDASHSGANIWLGGDGIDMSQMRIPGILQRIAFAYFVVAMMKLFLPVRPLPSSTDPYDWTWSPNPIPASVLRSETEQRQTWLRGAGDMLTDSFSGKQKERQRQRQA